MRRSAPLGAGSSNRPPESAPGSDEIAYAAVIALSLPGAEDVVTAQVVLASSDRVETGTRAKPLSDCTLLDIQQFADKLEQSMWETYQAIKLVDLAAGQDTRLEVTVQDKSGKTVSLSGWAQQAVLLSDEVSESDSLEDQSELGATPDHADAIDAREETEANEFTDSDREDGNDTDSEVIAEAVPTQVLTMEPLTVTVSESEPVYAEREAVDDPNAFPTPAIAPSRARVRIAGQRLPPGNPTWAAVDILIDEPALRSAQAHALSSPDREVAGVLLGPPPEKQPDGRYVVHVIDTIIAKYTVMHGASVTYTPESWRYMNDKLQERYPDDTAVIVGWYHTHPGFGIFLSGMDQFIHQHFFTQLWHTAMVLDPVERKSGFFSWDREQSRVGRYEFAWPGWAADSW